MAENSSKDEAPPRDETPPRDEAPRRRALGWAILIGLGIGLFGAGMTYSGLAPDALERRFGTWTPLAFLATGLLLIAPLRAVLAWPRGTRRRRYFGTTLAGVVSIVLLTLLLTPPWRGGSSTQVAAPATPPPAPPAATSSSTASDTLVLRVIDPLPNSEVSQRQDVRVQAENLPADTVPYVVLYHSNRLYLFGPCQHASDGHWTCQNVSFGGSSERYIGDAFGLAAALLTEEQAAALLPNNSRRIDALPTGTVVSEAFWVIRA